MAVVNDDWAILDTLREGTSSEEVMSLFASYLPECTDWKTPSTIPNIGLGRLMCAGWMLSTMMGGEEASKVLDVVRPRYGESGSDSAVVILSFMTSSEDVRPFRFLSWLQTDEQRFHPANTRHR